MYGCESCTIKKAESWRIEVFELCCWRRKSRKLTLELLWFFFCLFLLFKFYFIFKIYNIVLVLPNIEMNPPHVYICSPSWTLLPPHTIPLGRPSTPAPSIQYRALNLDWRLVSYMILYMFQCHSPKSSHPLPLTQSPKDCSIHQCLFCCLVHRVIVTIFLNSIYICVSILYWCFSFWLTSLCIIGSSFIHLIRTDSNVFFLMAE